MRNFAKLVSTVLRIYENDTFESVKIESVRVDRHPHSSTNGYTAQLSAVEWQCLQKPAVQSSIHYCVSNIQRQPTVVLLLLLLQYQKAYVIIHQDDFSLHFIYSTFVRNVVLQLNTYIVHTDTLYVIHM